MASVRIESPEVLPTDTQSESSFGLQNANVNRNTVLPEEWTLPKEHCMEKREPYSSWKADVQTQILNMGLTLDASLHDFPAEESGKGLFAGTELERKRKMMQFLKNSNADTGVACFAWGY